MICNIEYKKHRTNTALHALLPLLPRGVGEKGKGAKAAVVTAVQNAPVGCAKATTRVRFREQTTQQRPPLATFATSSALSFYPSC